MVKKSSPASGNGGRKARTSAAAAAPEVQGGVQWGLGAGTSQGADSGFTTDTASGQLPPEVGDITVLNGIQVRWDGEDWAPYSGPGLDPSEGDHKTIDGLDHVFTQGDWVLASEEVAGPAPEPKTKKQLAAEAKAAAAAAAQDAADEEGGTLSNMTNDLVHGVEALERLAEEIGALKDDAGEIMSELKSKGYTPKIIRLAIRRRAMDPDARNTEDSMLATYEEALRGS